MSVANLERNFAAGLADFLPAAHQEQPPINADII
jgi:hypothetical protein